LSRGHDDLRPHILVQFGSLVAVLFVSLFWESRYTRGKDIVVLLALYALAKLFELFDRSIFAFGGVNGHALKHFFAAIACYWVLPLLQLGEPTTSATYLIEPSEKRRAAVHVDSLASDGTGLIRAEKQRGAGNFVRRLGAAL